MKHVVARVLGPEDQLPFLRVTFPSAYTAILLDEGLHLHILLLHINRDETFCSHGFIPGYAPRANLRVRYIRRPGYYCFLVCAVAYRYLDALNLSRPMRVQLIQVQLICAVTNPSRDAVWRNELNVYTIL